MTNISFWKKILLSTRIMSVQVAINIALLACVLVLAGFIYRSDKLVYVYDALSLRKERLAQKLINDLEFMSNTSEIEKLDVLKAREMARTAGILQLPGFNEFFIMDRNGFKIVLSQKRSGQYFLFPLSPMPEIENSYGFSYWTVGTKSMIAAVVPLGISKAKLLERPIVKRFDASGVRSGLLTVNSKDGDSIAGFEEVPRTNTVVFVETSMAEAMRPLRAFLGMALASGLGIMILGAFVIRFFVQKQLKPVLQVAQVTQQISRGNYDVKIEYLFYDEIRFIFNHLIDMASGLKQREFSLTKLSENLKTTLISTQNMSKALQPLDAYKVFMNSLFESFVDSRKTNVIVFIQKKLGEFKSIQCIPLWMNGNAIEINTQIEIPPQWLAHFWLHNSEQKNPADCKMWDETHALSLPIRKGNYLRAVIVLCPLQFSALKPNDITFCKTLMASLTLILDNFDLREAEKLKARMDAELAAAQAVQQSMPNLNIKNAPFEVAAFYLPAEHVGGDWYGLFEDFKSGVLYLYLGDITGHGIASALVAAAVTGAVNAVFSEDTGAEKHPSGYLKSMLHAANSAVLHTSHGHHSSSAIFLALDSKIGKLYVLNAGHPPPFLLRHDGNMELLGSQNSILGLSEAVEGLQSEVQLGALDGVFLYTDGLRENLNSNGEHFTSRDLRKFTKNSVSQSAQNWIHFLEKSVLEYWQDESLADDVSCLFVKGVKK